MKLKKKITLSFIFLCVLSFLFTSYCSAKSNPSKMIIVTNRENLSKNDILCMSVKIRSSNSDSLSHLDMQINFDKDKLEFKKCYCRDKTGNTELTAEENSGGSLEISYINHRGLTLNANRLVSIFNLNFKVKNDAPVGKTDINATIKNISNGVSEIDLNSDLDLRKTLNIPDKTEMCTLKSLSPSEGELNLPFDPNILDYSVDVSSDVKDITFDFTPRDPDCEVKVSRHKLSAAGKTTNIKITVRNKPKKTKLVYNIAVNRAAKPENPKKKRHSTDAAKFVENSNRSDKRLSKKSRESSSPGTTGTKFYSDEELHESDDKNLPQESDNLDYDSGESSDTEDCEDDESDSFDESGEDDEYAEDKEDKNSGEIIKTEDYKSNSEPCAEAAPVNAMDAEEVQTSDIASDNFMPILIAAVSFTVPLFSYSVFQISKLYFQKIII